MKVLLNLLGILIYFLNRFSGRRQKNKTFSLRFWLTDNWPEFTVILLVDISLMILLLSNDISFDMAAVLPDWVVKTGDLTVSWVLGLGMASLVYNIIRKKIKAGG